MNSNDLNKILNEYLGKTNIQPSIEVFNDRKYSKRGWQYKKYGNSTAGYDKLMKCKKEMEELDYICKDTRNDYDLRAYQTYIFYANNGIVTVNTSPSRSGSSCEYIFKTYKEGIN